MGGELLGLVAECGLGGFLGVSHRVGGGKESVPLSEWSPTITPVWLVELPES